MFGKSENAYKGYHQVYDIKQYLLQNKVSLLQEDSNYWTVAYKKILSDFDWKMPENYKKKLQE